MKMVNIFQGIAKGRGAMLQSLMAGQRPSNQDVGRATPIRTRILVNVVNVVNEKKAMNIMLPLMSSLSQPGRLD